MKFVRKNRLYARISNYEFYKDGIHYLGHIISDKGIYVYLEKIEAIMSWPTPRKMANVRSFVGLVEYCRNFIERYSAGKVEPMYRLTRSACELVVP